LHLRENGVMSSVCPSVTSFSSHTSKARCLKLGGAARARAIGENGIRQKVVGETAIGKLGLGERS